MNNFKLLLQTLDLIVESKIWPDRKPSEILNILIYIHSKGWLYTLKDNDIVRVIICGYRIPEINDANLTKLPISESGNILYIPFVVSLDKDNNIFEVIRKSMKVFLEQNKDIEEIILEDKNNKIKRYSLKGELNGEK